MTGPRRAAGLLLVMALLAACSGDPDLELTARTSVVGGDVAVEYTLANRSGAPMVVYDGVGPIPSGPAGRGGRWRSASARTG
ncbi:hypothetical protein ACFQZ4_41445 [Catellatospora coxensis]